MTDQVPVRRALLSVSDKTGLVDLATALHARGIELISTGGTARTIEAAGMPVTPIDSVTGFPEMMDGRVKTLHPKVHGGLLVVRDNPAHAEAMSEHGIDPIDLVVVNLYPFEETVARSGVTRAEAIEQIDIGGPSMVRSAAKNHAYVGVVTSPDQYPRVMETLDATGGATTLALREDLAAAAFARTAAYDSAIAGYLASDAAAGLPETVRVALPSAQTLRYGENPHQPAALYADPSEPLTIAGAEQLHGKPLSYNNVLDAQAALEQVAQLDALERSSGRLDPAACVVKHTNPCGAAVAPDARSAVDAAVAGDPMAAYGGILAVSTQVDEAAAEIIAAAERFFEVVIAPRYTPGALAVLTERWKNVRLLAVGDLAAGWRDTVLELRGTPGELLVQQRDRKLPEPNAWTLSAGDEPGPEIRRAAGVLESVARALSSNAVCIGLIDPQRPGAVRLAGAGAGQMDRVAACRNAVEKAGDAARGAIAVSDAFFPFPDGPEILLDAGVSVIVQPGGAKRDEETLELCRRRGAACLLTGTRRFRH